MSFLRVDDPPRMAHERPDLAVCDEIAERLTDLHEAALVGLPDPAWCCSRAPKALRAGHRSVFAVTRMAIAERSTL